MFFNYSLFIFSCLQCVWKHDCRSHRCLWCHMLLNGVKIFQYLIFTGPGAVAPDSSSIITGCCCQTNKPNGGGLKSSDWDLLASCSDCLMVCVITQTHNRKMGRRWNSKVSVVVSTSIVRLRLQRQFKHVSSCLMELQKPSECAVRQSRSLWTPGCADCLVRWLGGSNEGQSGRLAQLWDGWMRKWAGSVESVLETAEDISETRPNLSLTLKNCCVPTRISPV